jgi:hypothetical protein
MRLPLSCLHGPRLVLCLCLRSACDVRCAAADHQTTGSACRSGWQRCELPQRRQAVRSKASEARDACRWRGGSILQAAWDQDRSRGLRPKAYGGCHAQRDTVWRLHAAVDGHGHTTSSLSVQASAAERSGVLAQSVAGSRRTAQRTQQIPAAYAGGTQHVRVPRPAKLALRHGGS